MEEGEQRQQQHRLSLFERTSQLVDPENRHKKATEMIVRKEQFLWSVSAEVFGGIRAHLHSLDAIIDVPQQVLS